MPDLEAAITPRIVPSVLPADHADMGAECRRLEAAGVDRIQWDVMDGQFVPNLTFGPTLIGACRRMVDVAFEAHMMIREPEQYIQQYVDAGCQWVILHAESTDHIHRALGMVREAGAHAGLALNPGTPYTCAQPLLDLVDLLLVMTVNPGFGGQDYIASMEAKIGAARRDIASRGLSIPIEVDGGIGPDTIAGAARAGAEVFVSGTALWRYSDLSAGVEDLRRRAAEAADSQWPPTTSSGPDRA